MPPTLVVSRNTNTLSSPLKWSTSLDRLQQLAGWVPCGRQGWACPAQVDAAVTSMAAPTPWPTVSYSLRCFVALLRGGG